jgi:hypothetical protein
MLKFECATELRLASGTLKEDDQSSSNGHRAGVSEVFLYECQREVDTSGNPRRGPQGAVAYKNWIYDYARRGVSTTK